MKKKKKIDKEQTLYWAVFILFAVLIVVIAQVWTEDQLKTVFNYDRSSIVSRLLPKTELNKIKDWQVYVDPDSRFRFRFPETWILDSRTPNYLVIANASNKIIIDFFQCDEWCPKINTESFDYRDSNTILVGTTKKEARVSIFQGRGGNIDANLKIVYIEKLVTPLAITLTYSKQNYAEAEAIFNLFLGGVEFFKGVKT